MRMNALKAAGLLLCWVNCTVHSLPSPQPKRPCEGSSQYKQFDFWVGEWDVTAQGKIIAQSSIQKIVDGCVVLENYSQTGGYTGKSLNFYDAVLGKWRQTYVDSTGRVAEFVGEYKDGAMRFEGEAHLANGQKRISRMSFYDLGADRIRQQAENSTDGGKTWRTVVDLLYVRRNVTK